MKNRNSEHKTTAEIEIQQTEYKIIARRELRDIFSDVLESAELEKRLLDINNIQFVTPERMTEIAKTNPKDAGADGLMRLEVSETEVKRVPIVMMGSSRANTLHTLLHESVHLMTPKPVFVPHDPMRKLDMQTFYDYVGGYKFKRFRDETNSVDLSSVPSVFEEVEYHNQRFLFWEAVTDWIAADDKVFSDEELKEIENSGYFERHMINYLWAQCPDDQGLFRALKASCVQGSEDPLRLFLLKLKKTQDNQMYDQLLKIIGRTKKNHARIDDWKAVVNKYFQTTK